MQASYKGRNGEFRVEGDELVVVKTGMLSSKVKGEVRVPLAVISGVMLRPASAMTAGWLQIGTYGSPLNSNNVGAASADPNTVMFNKTEVTHMTELANWLDQAASVNRESGKFATGLAARTGLAFRGGVIFTGVSHEGGRNARVTLYSDRIERVKERAFTSMQRVAQDTEVTPVRAVSSVQAKKDGLINTKVTVYASGNNIDFRFNHAEAQQFKDALLSLILQPDAATQANAPAPAPVSQPDLIQQIQRLGELHEAGVLTQEEFDAKKAELLSRL